MILTVTPRRPRSLLLLLALPLLSSPAAMRAQDPAADRNAPIKLDQYTVSTDEDDSFDETGMGTYDAELQDAPFANDLVSLNDDTDDDSLISSDDDISAITTPSPEDRITGDTRFKLRGVNIPELRDGFIRIGVPESLNVRHTLIIQGALIPVLGRAAPGGIRSTETARPRARSQVQTSLMWSSHHRQRYGLEYTGPVIRKKLWQRIAVDWSKTAGPEQFAHTDSRDANLGFTWKHSRRASTRVAIDYSETRADASPGIPDYRASDSDLILGPYLPLAEFNANGPTGDIFRRSTSATVQFDGAPLPRLSVRANLEGWRRTLERDHYPRPVLDLDTGRFSGVRKPRHLVQDDRAYVAQLEATWRFRWLGADQKALVAAGRTAAASDREDRTLDNAALAAFPDSALHFDPAAPDYYRPAYTPGLYSRLLTDRAVDSTYTAIEASDRIALRGGRYVISAGLRFDRVDQRVANDLPSASVPLIADHTTQLSHHIALNWVAQPSRLLLFAAASTAFDPTTPVDSRTGRIQPNENTLGYEAGLKARLAGGKFTLSASALLLYNRDISRRNPLYNDPIADVNQTQPELVAAGQERFTGAHFEGRWQPTPTLRLRTRGYWLDAVTTASPDLPQEVGRKVSRLPALSFNTELRRSPPDRQPGYTWELAWQYIGSYVATYPDAKHAYLAYPGYALFAASAGYRWIRADKRSVSLTVGVRNLLDRNLLASNARTGAGREFIASGSVAF